MTLSNINTASILSTPLAVGRTIHSRLGLLATTLVMGFAPETACAAEVLVIYDSLDNETGHIALVLKRQGHTVVLSDTDETGYDGTNPSPYNFDVVVHLDGSTAEDEMPTAGQEELLAFVQDGGGYLHTEWLSFEVHQGRMLAMQELILFDFLEGAGNRGLVYSEVAAQAGHPILANTPATFWVYGLGYSRVKARVDPLEPITVLMTDDDGNDAIAVREYGAGRIVGFHLTPNWMATFGGPYTDPDIKQLVVDAVEWLAP